MRREPSGRGYGLNHDVERRIVERGEVKAIVFLLHGVAISLCYFLVKSLLMLLEWFVRMLSDWGGMTGDIPWWATSLLTIMLYPPLFIYYRENQGQVNPVDDLYTALMLIPLLLIGWLLL